MLELDSLSIEGIILYQIRGCDFQCWYLSEVGSIQVFKMFSDQQMSATTRWTLTSLEIPVRASDSYGSTLSAGIFFILREKLWNRLNRVFLAPLNSVRLYTELSIECKRSSANFGSYVC
jgi:hypothetical protein